MCFVFKLVCYDFGSCFSLELWVLELEWVGEKDVEGCMESR